MMVKIGRQNMQLENSQNINLPPAELHMATKRELELGPEKEFGFVEKVAQTRGVCLLLTDAVSQNLRDDLGDDFRLPDRVT